MRRRRGFTLIFVIVLTAIFAALMAIVAESVAKFVDVENAQTTVTTLKSIADGYTSFAANVGPYPSRVKHLSDSIRAGNALYKDSCAGNYATGERTLWYRFGPFIPFIAAGGANSVWTPVGYVNDTIVRNPAAKGTDSAWIQMNGISYGDARMLDVMVDGDTGRVSGTIKYNTPANDTTTLKYYLTGLANKC